MGGGSNEEVVIPYGMWLDDDVDLGGADITFDGTEIGNVLKQLIRLLIILIFIFIIFPIFIIIIVRKYLWN